jgi:hypothetical protein
MREVHIGWCIRCKQSRDYRLELGSDLTLEFRNASTCPVCGDNLFWYQKKVHCGVVVIAEEKPI